MNGDAVFTYGTLEIPDVMQAVTGRIFDSVGGIADGYARYLLKGRIYPGMTPASDQITSGRVYFGLTQTVLKRLDEFEDDIYVRHLINVKTVDGHLIQAYAYIIETQNKKILSVQPWVRENFVKTHLISYLEACRKFSRSIQPGIFPSGSLP